MPPGASCLQPLLFFNIAHLLKKLCRKTQVPGVVSKYVCSTKALDWKYLRLYFWENQSYFPAAADGGATRNYIDFHKSEIAFTCYINIKINQKNIDISSALKGYNLKSVSFCSCANLIYLLFLQQH